MIDDLFRDAVIRANKLGAKGIQVVDIIPPLKATDDYKIRFVTIPNPGRSASEKPWYE